jgi:hypothetical protein
MNIMDARFGVIAAFIATASISASVGALSNASANGDTSHMPVCRMSLLGCATRSLASVDVDESANASELSETRSELPMGPVDRRLPSETLYTGGFAIDNTFHGTPVQNEGWQIPLPSLFGERR